MRTIVRHIPLTVVLFLITVVTMTTADVVDAWRRVRHQDWWRAASRDQKLDFLAREVTESAEQAGMNAGFAFLLTPPSMHGVTVGDALDNRAAQ